MSEALRQSPTPAGTLVIGTDCPALGAAQLRDAARRLADHDAVVVPAEDGGYVLIGTRSPPPAVFDEVEWGTDQVMAQTRRRLAALGCRWSRAGDALGCRSARRSRTAVGLLSRGIALRERI